MDAPERCRECSKASAEHSHPRAWRTYGTPYCSRACKSAGIVAVCEKCRAKVDLDWPRCFTCKWGFFRPQPPPEKRYDDYYTACMTEEEQARLRRWCKMGRDLEDGEKLCCLRWLNLFCVLVHDPDHQPAWKRRRRS